MNAGSEATKQRGHCPMCPRVFTLRRAGLGTSKLRVKTGELYIPNHSSPLNEPCIGSGGPPA